ncbi:hypothetical protein AAHZ94_34370 [Streptomyces sp. HSW2009]|uniref:hypothetical protein n=1 Tax=Streptomyces sp. HSW2009 TaxID=3142890 RepID=UPI0032EE2B0B
MNDRDYAPDAEPTGTKCPWCHGTGTVHHMYAYAPGVDPFGNDTLTVGRAGTCKHCRGTGEYDSTLDPTLDAWRRRTP